MKKVLTLLVIACLGVGAGIYTAKKTQNINFEDWFKKQEQKEQVAGPWDIVHPHWKGQLIVTNGNRVRLQVNGDMATIISNKDGVLTIKWDKWGRESFKCNDKNSCTLMK